MGKSRSRAENLNHQADMCRSSSTRTHHCDGRYKSKDKRLMLAFQLSIFDKPEVFRALSSMNRKLYGSGVPAAIGVVLLVIILAQGKSV